MPQVDLEALVSVCGGSTSDRKIGCEPVADDDSHDVTDIAEVPTDFPPESFWLSKDAEFDWFDRNAFLERKESTRGNANPANANHSNSNSQRFLLNLKSKAAIIGLPKSQKNNYVDKRRHCKPPNIRLFPPKRSESVGKSTAQMTEPSSPKVSCMGRVRSKRSRRRRPSEPEKQSTKSAECTRSTGKAKKKGFCSGLMSLFRRRDCAPVNTDGLSVKSSSCNNTKRKKSATPLVTELVAEPPGLGGMTRFVSGRRSESWGADEIDTARRDSVDLQGSVSLARSGSRRS